MPNQLEQIKHKNLRFDNHMMWVDFRIVHLGDTLVLGLRLFSNYEWKSKENPHWTLT